jgi:uncharacterized membrane protein
VVSRSFMKFSNFLRTGILVPLPVLVLVLVPVVLLEWYKYLSYGLVGGARYHFLVFEFQ